MDYDSLVTRLTPRAKRALRLVACGHSQSEAARQLCFSLSRLCVIANSTLGRDYLAMLETDVNAAIVEKNAEVELDIKKEALERIKDEIPESIETLCNLRDGGPPAVMLGATNRLLDMAGLTVKQEMIQEHKVLADQGLLEAIQRLTQVPQATPEPAAGA